MPMHQHTRLRAILIVLSLSAAAAMAAAAQTNLGEVRGYIKESWRTLARSLRDLPAAARDPKFRRAPGNPLPVYIASTEG